MTCGGTGGHINPAIAIANTIKKRIPNAEILFVGTKRGQESVLVPRAGYELKFVESEGIRRSLSPANIRAVARAIVSPIAAQPIIREFSPDVVVGTGGYACWPILKGASMMGIPTVVHESNAVPGMAVKQLQKSVDKILLNFEKSKEYMSKKAKTVRVGNPISDGFSTMEKTAARAKHGIPADALCVLSYGGSGGAEFLNGVALEVMKEYVASRREIVFIQATGARNYPEIKARFESLGLQNCPNIRLLEYIYDMPEYMAAADVVICRAGAMTVSELALMRKCAVLIPSPYVADNHQYLNAKALADKGAAMRANEADLSGTMLSGIVDSILADRKTVEKMQNAISAFAKPDANLRIWKEIQALIAK